MQVLLRMLTFGMVLAVVFSHVGLSAQGSDPVIGTWELNLAKSKFSPGPPPKSVTRTYEATGQGVKASFKGVNAEGKPTLVQYTANYDGKDNPMTGSPAFDSIAAKRIDAFTAEFTLKKAGKVVATAVRVISKDGKVFTLTTKGTNTQGQAVNSVQVFEKR